MLQKIQELITQLQMSRDKSRDTVSQSSSQTKRYSKKWSNQQQTLLCDLIVRFGTDFTLLEEYFPHKTRKQIKKKYKHIFEYRQKKLNKIENEFQKERRKSFFDEEILQDGRKCKEEGEGDGRNDVQQQSFM